MSLSRQPPRPQDDWPVISSALRSPADQPPSPSPRPTHSHHLPIPEGDVHDVARSFARQVIDRFLCRVANECAILTRNMKRTGRQSDQLTLVSKALRRAFRVRPKRPPNRAIYPRRFRTRQGRYPFQRSSR